MPGRLSVATEIVWKARFSVVIAILALAPAVQARLSRGIGVSRFTVPRNRIPLT
jgi:hypothetical protein